MAIVSTEDLQSPRESLHTSTLYECGPLAKEVATKDVCVINAHAHNYYTHVHEQAL